MFLAIRTVAEKMAYEDNISAPLLRWRFQLSDCGSMTVCSKETILVVEDDKTLGELSQLVLESSGYHVILATDGREALHLFKANIGKIKLVVLDVVMPLVSGPEVRAQILALRPNLPVVLMSGHIPESISLRFGIAAGAPFIQKPYTTQGLKDTIRAALDRAK